MSSMHRPALGRTIGPSPVRAESRAVDHTQQVFERTVAPVIPILAVLVVVLLLTGGGTPPVDRLTGVTWHWTGTTGPDADVPTTPPGDAVYTVTFQTDRTFAAQADCNAVAGTYRRIPPGRVGPLTGLVVTLGPTTLAACGPGSASEAFIADLARSATYAVTDDGLTITLTDFSRMTFR